MPALLAALVLVIAVILEISRSNNSMRTSVQTTDARNAVAAAEFGFEAIVDQLNNDENDYLLATKFTNPSGTGDWQTVTSANLFSCGIKAPSTAPSANRIAGVATNLSNTSVVLPTNVTASYSLIGYEPPAQEGSPAQGCDMFGNLLGGRARLTVRGTVQRNGLTTATYDLVREVSIRNDSSDMPENNLGLVITGLPGKSKTGSPFHIVYDENGDGAISVSGSTITEPLGNVNCILCNSPSQLNTSGTSLDSVIPGPIPNFPTFPSLPPELYGMPLGSLTLTYRNNYPFTTASTTPGSFLVDECKWLRVGGVDNAEIGCRVGDMSGFGTLAGACRSAAGSLLRRRQVRRSVAVMRLYVTDGNPATSRTQDARALLEESLDLRYQRHPRSQRLQLHPGGDTQRQRRSRGCQAVVPPGQGQDQRRQLREGRLPGLPVDLHLQSGLRQHRIPDPHRSREGMESGRRRRRRGAAAGGGYRYRAMGAL